MIADALKCAILVFHFLWQNLCYLICFLLLYSLCGYPPFNEQNTQLSLKDQITRGEYTFIPKEWKHVSDMGMTPLQWVAEYLTVVVFCLPLTSFQLYGTLPADMFSF